MPNTLLKNPVSIDVTSSAVGLSVSGVAAVPTTGPGASAADVLTVQGASGQDTIGAGQSAGAGAGVSITAGPGGAAPSGSTNGAGGSVTINPGPPGTGGTGGTYGHVSLAASGGNVGIGTSSPNAKLQVYSPSGTTAQTLTVGTSTDRVQFIAQNGSNSLYFGIDNSSGGGIATGSAADAAVVSSNGNKPLHLAANATVAATILGNGNIGIGVTSPTSRLHILSPSGTTAQVLAVGTSSDRVNFIAQNNANSLLLGVENSAGGGIATGSVASAAVVSSNGDKPLHLAANGTVAATILGNGNVGIGTTSPTSKFQVYSPSGTTAQTLTVGTSTDRVQFIVQNGSNSLYFGIDNSSGGGIAAGSAADAAVISSNGNKPLQLAANAIVAATVLASGNVGIATSAPTSKLHVNGGVQVGTPIGGDKGTGSINVSDDIYRNGTPQLKKLDELTKRIERLEAMLSRKAMKTSSAAKSTQSKKTAKSRKERR